MRAILVFAVIFLTLKEISCHDEIDNITHTTVSSAEAHNLQSHEDPAGFHLKLSSYNTPLNSAPNNLKSPLRTGRRLLVSGGATNPYNRSFEALHRPILGSMGNATLDILSDIQDGLRYVLQTKNEYTLAFHGTGTTGMIGILDNLIEPGDKILVGVNGYWGEAVANISAQRFGANVVKIEKPIGARFSSSEIEMGLQQHRPNILYLVSGESSSGVYQPLDGVGDLCYKYDCITAVDIVATVGQQPIKMDDNKIDAVFMNSQKGCGGIVGLAPVSFSPRAVRKIKDRATFPRAYQTDIMNKQDKAWFIDRSVDFRKAYAHSISLPLLYMLREGLASVVDEGIENVWSRHADAHRYLNHRASQLGLRHFVPKPEDRLIGTSLFKVPTGKDAFKIESYMLNKHSIEITPGFGLGATLGKVIRIGLFGNNAKRRIASRIMNTLEDALHSQSTDL